MGRWMDKIKSVVKDPTIIELEKQLRDAENDIAWYYKKMTEKELIAINLKKTIERLNQ